MEQAAASETTDNGRCVPDSNPGQVHGSEAMEMCTLHFAAVFGAQHLSVHQWGSKLLVFRLSAPTAAECHDQSGVGWSWETRSFSDVLAGSAAGGAQFLVF